jgi:hypothetical protein
MKMTGWPNAVNSREQASIHIHRAAESAHYPEKSNFQHNDFSETGISEVATLPL